MAGYSDNVEIRVGSLAVDTNDVGNVKLFSHSPQREIHEIISGLTNSAIDVKEFINADTMKFTADHHVADKLRWYFGNKYTTIATPGAVLAVNRVLVVAEQITLSGSNEDGNRTLLLHGGGVERPISIECVQLTMQLAAYVDCVPLDIGAAVTSVGSGDSGILRAYNNTTRVWLVERDVHANQFAALDVCSCTTAGTGTIAAAGDILPCGVFDDSIQTLEYDEHAAVDDFTINFYDGSVSRTRDGAIADPQTVYIWYSYYNPTSETISLPKGDTEVSTRGEYIYTKVLANGKTQEIKIPDGYITNMVEIPHSPGELTEYSVEVKSVEHAAAAGYEHGYDKRTA